MIRISTDLKSFPHLTIFLLFLPLFVQSQDKSILAKDTTIGLNQYLLVKAIAPFSKNLRISDFPEIPDFSRKRTVYSREDSIITIAQYYKPRKQGVFTTTPLFLILNGDTISHKPLTIRVTGPAPDVNEPDFPSAEAPYTESRPQAFLRLELDSKEVYKRQAVNGTVYLYIPDDENADLNFIDLKQQMIRMSEQLRPRGTLASIRPVPETGGAEHITENGRNLQRYVILRGSWLPYSAGEIDFPGLELTMLTYSESKNEGFIDRKDQLVTFETKPAKVLVKDLPDHPLKDRINAGRFSLKTRTGTQKPEAGRAFQISLQIQGKAPPSFLQEPVLREGSLKFYRLKEEPGLFRYQVVAEKPGKYQLADHIYWVYFDTRLEQYDTLKPSIHLEVKGTETPDGYERAREFDPFYGKIGRSSSRLRSIYQDDRFRYFGNVFILAMLAFAAWLVLWKRKG